MWHVCIIMVFINMPHGCIYSPLTNYLVYESYIIPAFILFTRWRELKQQVDLRQQELHLLEEKLKQGTHHVQLEEIEGLEKTIG